MKYSSDKKQAINSYILEKISDEAQSLSKIIAETFNISTNTAHTYINHLLNDGIITKEKRGEYKLVKKEQAYSFSRGDREFKSDTLAYDVCLAPIISHLSENAKHIWMYAVSEMVNNVIDHSSAENMTVTVTQDYLKTSVTISDNGVGIFEKIKTHFNLPSLEEAICELFKGKLTTDESNHSGEGIFFTSKMMDVFRIYSSGKVFTTSKYESDGILNACLDLPGTTVFMSLSNFTQKTAKDIFDEYSNDDGAFSTTRIPLKNIFDSAPISRSQAKRICNRLDKFEEVILDFKDISWMGQGFAHQIFVVYQNAHPDTTIKTVNMNESIASMYNHVVKSI